MRKCNNFRGMVILISIFISLNAWGQRDTINFKKGQLYLVIKDTQCFPKGYSQDSFVITNDSTLDTIFYYYKVKKLVKLFKNNYHGILDSTYKLFCECDEYKLMDTLQKFNYLRNNTLFYYVERIPIDINTINQILPFKKIILYPNPVNHCLIIQNYEMKPYELRIYSQNGQILFESFNIEKDEYILDMSNYTNGLYYLLIFNQKGFFIEKIIKL
jgi:hypothetical protein